MEIIWSISEDDVYRVKVVDVGYYHFVLDGIQELCEKAQVYPCLLDAAIFSSFDKNAWTMENVRF